MSRNPVRYRIICVSTYPADVDRIDDIVLQLKRLGLRRASRSGVLRTAALLVTVEQLHANYSVKPSGARRQNGAP